MDFVFIANAWSAGEENPTSKHRIAIELSRRGHRVLWVEGSGMRTPSLGSGSDRGRIVRKIAKATKGATEVAGTRIRQPDVSGGQTSGKPQGGGGIWVLSPLFAPFPKYAACRRFNGWLCRRVAVKWCRKLGMREPVLINYVPVLHEAMRGWPGMKVYHCVDRWDAFAMYDQAVMARGDEACCRIADRVIASSRDLEARCRRFNSDVRMITHGVDHSHFAGALSATQAPAGLPDGRIIGFFGLLSEWLDQGLLVSLATQLPDAHVVLIGKADVNVDRLLGLPNLHLIGPRPFAELPSLIARFDVGIIPFLVNDLTKAVNPIKLREMLAGGCPVVSTHLPEVESYAGSWVDVTDTAEAFVACVRNRLANVPSVGQRRDISMSVAGETWAAKVDEMLEWIGKKRG